MRVRGVVGGRRMVVLIRHRRQRWRETTSWLEARILKLRSLIEEERVWEEKACVAYCRQQGLHDLGDEA